MPPYISTHSSYVMMASPSGDRVGRVCELHGVVPLFFSKSLNLYFFEKSQK